MRSVLAVIMTVGALAAGGSVYGAQGTAAPAPEKEKKPAAQAVHTVKGTLMKFDSASNRLTLSTAKGEETYVIGAKATLHQGRKVITAPDLASLTGYEVTVRYAESAGEKNAESVMVSARPAAAKPAPTTGTGKSEPAPSGGKKY